MPYNIVQVPGGFKVQSETSGRFLSRNPMTKAEARKQQKAIYAKEKKGHFLEGSGFIEVNHYRKKHHILDGAGFFSDLFEKSKKVFNEVKNKVVSVAKEATSRVGAVIEGPRKGYPPKVRQYLQTIRLGQINSIQIRRNPIQSIIQIVLNQITQGKLEQVKRTFGYDKLFHLSMIVGFILDDKQQFCVMEKNEVINISPSFQTTSDTEYFTLPAIPSGLTIAMMINSTERAVGKSFFLYDAFTNNCQMFLLNILQKNGLLTAEADEFINQRADELVLGLPSYTQPIARGLTDLAAVANLAIQGEGKCGLPESLCECEGGVKNIIVMPSKDYFSEHKRLIGLLNETSGKLKAEADEQQGEVNAREKKGSGKTEKELAEKVIIKALEKARTANPGVMFSGPDGALERAILKSIQAPEIVVGRLQGDGITDAYKRMAEKRNKDLRETQILQRTNPKAAAEKLVKQAMESAQRKAEIAYETSYEGKKAKYDARYEKYLDENPTQRFFQKAVQGLTDVADFAVDNIASKVGVPKVLTEAYKAFAPPTSKFYKGGKDTKLRGGSQAQYNEFIDALVQIVLENTNLSYDDIGANPTLQDLIMVVQFTDFGMGRTPTQLLGYFIADALDAEVDLGTIRGALEYLNQQQPGGTNALALNVLNQIAPQQQFQEPYEADPEGVVQSGTVSPSSASDPYPSDEDPSGSGKKQVFGVKPSVYIKRIKAIAKKKGYDSVELATDGVHKIEVTDPEGKKHYAGHLGYGDFHLYTLSGQKELAKQKQRVFRASHNKIKGDWRKDKFSPNNLALRILWS